MVYSVLLVSVDVLVYLFNDRFVFLDFLLDLRTLSLKFLTYLTELFGYRGVLLFLLHW